MEYLNIAIPKGKVMKSCLNIFKSIGYNCDEISDSSRKLCFLDEENKVKFFLVKSSDVPCYVEMGACDLGMSGLDTILEEGRNIKQIFDLGLGICRMVVAGKPRTKGQLKIEKVATKYPRITAEFLKKKGMDNVEIVKLNGSVELAPLCGISDVIVDIVETGTTLKENGLEVLEEIIPLSTRLIKCANTTPEKEYSINQLVNRIESVVSKKLKKVG